MTLKTIGNKTGLMPSLFGDAFDSWDDWYNEERFAKALTVPRANISENPGHYSISVAVPGLDKKDFRISVDGNKLIVSAENETNEERTEERFTRREYNYSSFSRSFYLPGHVDKEKIEAVYEGGILKLFVPKVSNESENNDRTIEVK